MKLVSNISQVVRRLELFQEGIPDAIRMTISPKYWAPLFRGVANRTLSAEVHAARNAQTRLLYAAIVERMIPSGGGYGLMTAVFDGAMTARFSLAVPADALKKTRAPLSQFHSPSDEDKPAAGYSAEARAFNQGEVLIGSDRMRDWHEQNLQSVRETIDKWVMLEKRIDERDAGLTEQQISERVQWIMGVAPGQRAADQSPLMRELGEKIAGAIQKWLDGEGETPPVKGTGGGTGAMPKGETALSPEVAALWLGKVLLAWRVYLEAELPHRFKFAMTMLRMRVKQGGLI